MSHQLPPEEFYRAATEAERKVRALDAALKEAIAERKEIVDEAVTRKDVQVTRTAEAMGLDRRRLYQIYNGENENGHQRRQRVARESRAASGS